MVGAVEQTAQIGQRLGRYELLARIARGGMAEVYVARVRGEGGFEKLVAVKIMLPSFAEDPRFVEMFLDEGRIAGHIESPHVVQVLDVGRANDGTLFIVMDLVRGVPLNRLVAVVGRARKRLPVAVAVSIIAQAADGLAAAHDAATPLGEKLGVVHRDVSPQNILIGADGRVRVVDFGIARALLRRATTSTGELKGKFGYFAPEQLMGKQADARSDIFALGVVAWESLTSRRLFHSENPLEALEKVRATTPERLDMVRKDVSAELALAVDHALQRNPSARYAQAAEFAGDLRTSVKTTLADQGQIGAFVRKYCMEDLQGLEDKIRRALTADTRQGPIDESDHGEPLVQKPASGVVPFFEGMRSGSLRSRVPSQDVPRAPAPQGYTAIGNPSLPSIVMGIPRETSQARPLPAAPPSRAPLSAPRTMDVPASQPVAGQPSLFDSSQEETHIRPFVDPLPDVPANLQTRALTTPVKAPPPPSKSSPYDARDNASQRFLLPDPEERTPLGSLGVDPWDAPPPRKTFPFTKLFIALMLVVVGALATYAWLLNEGRDPFASSRQSPQTTTNQPQADPGPHVTPPAAQFVPSGDGPVSVGVDAAVVFVPVLDQPTHDPAIPDPPESATPTNAHTPSTLAMPDPSANSPNSETPASAGQFVESGRGRRRRFVRRSPTDNTPTEGGEPAERATSGAGFFALPDNEREAPAEEQPRPQRIETPGESEP